MKLFASQKYWKTIFKNVRLFLIVSFLLGVYQLNAKAEWTILVYAQAKNNLSNFAYKNFNDMAIVGSGTNLNILVQWYQPDQQGVWRYKVEKGKLILDVCLPINTDGNKANDLVDSMRWAATKFPAEKYFLILWNHGIGIVDPIWGNQKPWSAGSKFTIDPSMLKENPKICINGITCDDPGDAILVDPSDLDESNTGTLHRGILFNEQSKTYMNNQVLTSALSQIKTSVLNNQKINILGMDACLMAMLEVGYQARDYADYMVASQEVELAYGWNYLTFLQSFAGGRISPVQAAQSVVASYQSLYKDKIQFYTQSAIDLSHLDGLKASLDTVVQYLSVCQRIDKDALAEAIKQARRNCLQFSATSYIDLHSFFIELNKSIALLFDKKFSSNYAVVQLKGAVNKAVNSIEQSVVASASGAYLSRAKGLSIYFPMNHIDGSYQHTEFAKDSLWFNFLKEIVYR